MSGRINPGGHGWTKDAAPPPPGSRPTGLPKANKSQGDISMTEEQQTSDEQPGSSGPTESDLDQGQDAQPTTSDVDAPPVAEQAAREAELNDQRYEHAQRTGGGNVNVGEVEAQRDEHNARTGGGVDDTQDQA